MAKSKRAQLLEDLKKDIIEDEKFREELLRGLDENNKLIKKNKKDLSELDIKEEDLKEIEKELEELIEKEVDMDKKIQAEVEEALGKKDQKP